MRKKVLIISSVFVILYLVFMGYVFAPKSVYEVEFEKDITVQEGVAQVEELEYVMVIPKTDEYVVYAKWDISPAGLLLACNIVDESGKNVNTFSADCMDMASGAMKLSPGKYTMTLTFISNEEQWKEYFAGFDTTNWDEPGGEEPETTFVSNGEFHIDFDLDLETYTNISTLATVLALGITAMLIILLFALILTGDSMKRNYDERQELLRGRGFKYAFFTMIIMNCVFYTLEAGEVFLPINGSIVAVLSTLVGVGVYAVYCIWNDAYFALNVRARGLIIFFIFGGILNLILGIRSFMDETAVIGNELTFRSVNLFCGIEMLVICGAILLKKFCKDREEE